MTRKTRNKQVRDATAIDACNIKTNNDTDLKPNSERCGYCEKCRVEYDVLALHLQSKEHINFVKNNDNYIALDNLINSSTNVENFLRMNSGQMTLNDESERNGVGGGGGGIGSVHSPKRDSLITTRVNYLSHTTSYSGNNDKTERNNDTTTNVYGGAAAVVAAAAAAKSHKQMNGVAHHADDVSPSKFNNIRDKLPKYSPPITRRSQTKNSIQIVLDDSHSNDTKSKQQSHEKFASIIVGFEERELNFISKVGK